MMFRRGFLAAAALLVVPFIYEADTAAIAYTIAAGIAIMALSVRRGPIRETYQPRLDALYKG